MTTSHTPGPWHTKYGSALIIDIWPEGRKEQVAKVYTYRHDNVGEANARLIAAAPDLLEACHDVLDHFAGCEGCTALENQLAQTLKDVIRKAESPSLSQ